MEVSKAPADGFNELTEILARGCLRLIINRQEGIHKELKQLDKAALKRDELDRELTTLEKRRKP